MLHPDIELRFLNEGIGYGLVARRPIPRGTITWVHCALEQVFAPKAYRVLTGPYRTYLDKYAYLDRKRNRILCCDHGRFMNHSCEPNSLTLPDIELEFAVRDIAAGEEVTDDYGTLNLDEDLICLCGSPRCRGLIRASDALELAPTWETLLQDALDRVPVWQPLAGFVKGDLRDRLSIPFAT